MPPLVMLFTRRGAMLRVTPEQSMPRWRRHADSASHAAAPPDTLHYAYVDAIFITLRADYLRPAYITLMPLPR